MPSANPRSRGYKLHAAAIIACRKTVDEAWDLVRLLEAKDVLAHYQIRRSRTGRGYLIVQPIRPFRFLSAFFVKEGL